MVFKDVAWTKTNSRLQSLVELTNARNDPTRSPAAALLAPMFYKMLGKQRNNNKNNRVLNRLLKPER